jgi:hypothetical protein
MAGDSPAVRVAVGHLIFKERRVSTIPTFDTFSEKP